MHDLFVKDGATNVRWVWSPNVEYSTSTPFADVYPGDAYVDWIGVSGYNDGPTDQWHYWTSLHDVFAQSYADLTALSSKPMMIAETASTETGGIRPHGSRRASCRTFQTASRVSGQSCGSTKTRSRTGASIRRPPLWLHSSKLPLHRSIRDRFRNDISSLRQGRAAAEHRSQL